MLFTFDYDGNNYGNLPKIVIFTLLTLRTQASKQQHLIENS